MDTFLYECHRVNTIIFPSWVTSRKLETVPSKPSVTNHCYNASTYSEYLVRQSRPVQVDGAADPDVLAEPRLQPRAPTDLQPRIVGLLASVNGR